MKKILCVGAFAALLGAAGLIPAQASFQPLPAAARSQVQASAVANLPATAVLTAAKAARDNTYDLTVALALATTVLGPARWASGDAAPMSRAQRAAVARAAFD